MAVKWSLKKDDVNWQTYWDKTSIEDELTEVKNDYPRMLNVILDYSTQDSVVLEGGCGLAKFLFFLREKGYKNLIGVDFTEKPLQLIKEQDPSIIVKNGDVNDLPITDNSINMYLSMGVIEHFEEGPEQSLNEAMRVLKKNGILIVAVPYQNLYRGTIRKYVTMPILKILVPSFRNKNRVFYQYYYSKMDMIKYIRRAGFEIIDWFYHDQFHTNNERIGLCLEFPFLKSTSGGRYQLNQFGKIFAFISELFSKGIFSSGIAFVLKKTD